MKLPLALGLFFLDEMDKPTNIVITKDSIQLFGNDILFQSTKINEVKKIELYKFKIVFGNNTGIFELNKPSSANFTVTAVKYVLEKKQ